MKTSFILKKLRKLIQDCLESGENTLPSERDLSKQFNVSRPTISRMLAQLAGEGLVVRRHGSGTYIEDINKKQEITAKITIGVGLKKFYQSDSTYFNKVTGYLAEAANAHNAEIQVFDGIEEKFDGSWQDNSVMKCIKHNIINACIFLDRVPIPVIKHATDHVSVVLLNQFAGTGEAHCVSCDYSAAAIMAVNQLIKQKHKNIAFLHSDLYSPKSQQAYSGYRTALAINKIKQQNDFALQIHKDTDSINKFIEDKKITAALLSPELISTGELNLCKAILEKIPIFAVDSYVKEIVPELTDGIDVQLEEVCNKAIEVAIKQSREKFHSIEPTFTVKK